MKLALAYVWVFVSAAGLFFTVPAVYWAHLAVWDTFFRPKLAFTIIIMLFILNLVSVVCSMRFKEHLEKVRSDTPGPNKR